MISTKELLEWKKLIAKMKKEAEKLVREGKVKELYYYEDMAKQGKAHLALIERLIEQSRENDKEQICQK